MKKIIICSILLILGVFSSSMGMKKIKGLKKVYTGVTAPLKKIKLDKDIHNNTRTMSTRALSTFSNKKTPAPMQPSRKQATIKTTPNVNPSQTPSSFDFFKKLVARKVLYKNQPNVVPKASDAPPKNPLPSAIVEPVPEWVVAVKIPNSWRSWPRAIDGTSIPKKPQSARTLGSKKTPFGFARSIFNQTPSPFGSRHAGARRMHTHAKMDPKFLALDGKLASEKTPAEFVKLLHDNGLTVSDSVKIQVEAKKKVYLKKIFKTAGLSREEKKACQNALDLKHEWLKKYEEESKNDPIHSDFIRWKNRHKVESKGNIHFMGNFHPFIKQAFEDICKKRGLNFTLIVDFETPDEAFGVAGSIALPFTLSPTEGRGELPTVINKDNMGYSSHERFNIGLQPKYWAAGKMPCHKDFGLIENYDGGSLVRCVIEHEVTHILNLHTVEMDLLKTYLKKIKKVDDEIYKKCKVLHRQSHEYEADVSPMETTSGAESTLASSLPYRDHDENRGDYNISNKKRYELSLRALNLYKAEQEALRKKEDQNNQNAIQQAVVIEQIP